MCVNPATEAWCAPLNIQRRWDLLGAFAVYLPDASGELIPTSDESCSLALRYSADPRCLICRSAAASINGGLMFKLISATPSPYARKVRIALQEKGLPFELVTEVPRDSTTSTPK